MVSVEPLPLSPTWSEDILGAGFQRMTFEMDVDPDGCPPAIVTLVRYVPQADNEKFSTRPAIFYIPGTSDYFFHRHVAEFFHDRGYAFYAVDLRKCGRSWQPGQRWHYVTDLGIYFKDLCRATEQVLEDGHSDIFLLGHSTGGLLVPIWLDHLRASGDTTMLPFIRGAVLNSPWLDFFFPTLTMMVIRRLVPYMAMQHPEAKIYSRKLVAYVNSLHKDFDGEWDFSLDYKPVGGHDKYWGWANAIMRSIERVRSGSVKCPVPLLVLCSMHSQLDKPLDERTHVTDVVLDVDEIIKRSVSLGDEVTTIPIDNARHDVFLSRRPAREQALKTCEQWLTQQL